MPIIEIDGVGRVQVDDSFSRRSPAEQDAIVRDIARGVRGEKPSTPNIARIKENIGRMIDQGAPEPDIDQYLREEGVTAAQLRQHPGGGGGKTRNVTATFEDGSSHVYRGVPFDMSPQDVTARAEREFGKRVTSLDGGNPAKAPAPLATPAGSLPPFQIEDPAQSAMDRAAFGPATGAEQFSDEWLKRQEADYQASLKQLGYPAEDDNPHSPLDPDHPKIQSALVGLADGVMFGFGDEIDAAMGAVLGGSGYKSVWGGSSLSDAYAANVKKNREILAAAETEHPGAFYGGNLASAVIPIGAVGKIATGGKTLKGIATAARAGEAASDTAKASRLARYSKTAAAGAGYGAVYGAGSDEGSLTDRLDGALEGAAFGSVVSPALRGAGEGVAKAATPVLRRLLPKLAQSQFAAGQAGNVHVLTDAQVSQDIADLAEAMRVTAGRLSAKDAQAALLKRVDALEASYMPSAELAAMDLAPSVRAKLDAAMARRHLMSEQEVQALHDGTPAGEAVAEAIEKARRLRAYVPEGTGSPGAGSFLAETLGSAAGWKFGGPIGGAVGGRLGRAAARTEGRTAKSALALAEDAPRFAQLPEVQAARQAPTARAALAKLAAEAMDEPQRLAEEGRKVAIANARDNIMPTGGWRGLLYDRTGLLPAEQDAAALAALKDGAISAEQFDAYLDEPGKLMAGNAGNALVDRIASYAESGRFKRDPKWKPPQADPHAPLDLGGFALADDITAAPKPRDTPFAVAEGVEMNEGGSPTANGDRVVFAAMDKFRAEQGLSGDVPLSLQFNGDGTVTIYQPQAPATIRNPAAYAATAQGNQDRVTQALASLGGRADLSAADREVIGSAIASIGNTSKRDAAEQIVTDALGRLDEGPRDYARSLLSPLVAQIKR